MKKGTLDLGNDQEVFFKFLKEFETLGYEIRDVTKMNNPFMRKGHQIIITLSKSDDERT